MLGCGYGLGTEPLVVGIEPQIMGKVWDRALCVL